MTRRAKPRPPVLCALLLLTVLPSGCQSGWQVEGSSSCGSASWGSDCLEARGCDEGAAILLGAIYLAIAIPYLIAEACRSCP